MASTNKTPHLGLCQWEASDPFLREDMNGDFAKIDEAFGNLPRQKLFDVTFDGTVSAVQFDFTQIDLEQFGEFEMFLKFTSVRYMRINEVTDTVYQSINPGNNYTFDRGYMNLGTSRLVEEPSYFCIYSCGSREIIRLDKVKFPAINTIEFFAGSSNSFFNANERISIWGVRR